MRATSQAMKNIIRQYIDSLLRKHLQPKAELQLSVKECKTTIKAKFN